MAAVQTVRVQTAEGNEFELEYQHVKLSKTLTDIVEDLGDEMTVIPLPNVSGDVFKKIVEYFASPVVDLSRASIEKLEPEDLRKEKFDQYMKWYDTYFDAMTTEIDGKTQPDCTKYCPLLVACNYLAIQNLLDETSKRIAMHLEKEDSTPEVIRAVWHLPDDLTPEEKAAVERELEEATALEESEEEGEESE